MQDRLSLFDAFAAPVELQAIVPPALRDDPHLLGREYGALRVGVLRCRHHEVHDAVAADQIAALYDELEPGARAWTEGRRTSAATGDGQDSEGVPDAHAEPAAVRGVDGVRRGKRGKWIGEPHVARAR